MDYSTSGLSIRRAMLDHVKKHPDKNNRPDSIRWGDFFVKTSDLWVVNKNGLAKFEIIYSDARYRQGFDAKVNGWFELAGGERVPVLRTFKDESLEDCVEYPFVSEDGRLYVWNVYEMIYPNEHRVIERWTENAGFWVEKISETERVYHCSPGQVSSPEFGAFIFKVSIT